MTWQTHECNHEREHEREYKNPVILRATKSAERSQLMPQADRLGWAQAGSFLNVSPCHTDGCTYLMQQ